MITKEQEKEFNEKLVALLKEYKVNIVPTLGLRLEEVSEVAKDSLVGEVKVTEAPAK